MTDDGRPARRRNDDETLTKLKILAVDDDASYLRRIQLVLRRAGFEVTTATNGPDALARIREERDIDLLLVDFRMPVMDGIETVQRIREEMDLPALYAILLTATDGTETRLRAFDSGLDDFLSKTAPDTEIVAKLRSAARRLEMERRLHLVCEELQTLALTDELTGIANRRALFREGEQVLREGRRLSVVLFDLNRFKAINDTWGHLTGDRILADVAATFKAHTRYGDLIARYGGDEFVLLLPDTDLEEARSIADRLTAAVSALQWTVRGARIDISVTAGIATSGNGSTVATLLTECDARLYVRKGTSPGLIPIDEPDEIGGIAAL